MGGERGIGKRGEQREEEVVKRSLRE